ncbi:hypothetical protein [Actinomadura sp. HBU206391]|uniref:hypothetical protein n=1 Tax=Actinomadura sp. HBU206391 TaxID=2731692 RepID=UPI0016500670|nr:hypothetical protein [Actinomadura sp. HBU206391]MBC6463053.1 hypothetical protein [Actinomadura sp. HBU206391]
MSSKGKGESGRPPEGALANATIWGRRAVLTAVLLFFGGVWVAAAVYNVNELRKGALAAAGHYGEAGMVTVSGTVGIGKSRYCSGSFRSFDGSTSVSAKVEISGGCAPGVQKAARLVRGNDGGMFVGDEKDVAWTPGARGWFGELGLSLLFGGPVLLVCLGILKMIWDSIRRRPSSGDAGEATPG